MGDLDKVAVEMEDFRGLLRRYEKSPKSGGPTLEEETLQGALTRYGEDAIVGVAVAIHQLKWDSKDQLLRDGVAILDYLDTLGMEVRFKK